MPQQEFDLLQIAAILPAELGSGASEVVGAEVFDPNVAQQLNPGLVLLYFQ